MIFPQILLKFLLHLTALLILERASKNLQFPNNLKLPWENSRIFSFLVYLELPISVQTEDLSIERDSQRKALNDRFQWNFEPKGFPASISPGLVFKTL